MVTFFPSYINCTNPEGATLEQVAGDLVYLIKVSMFAGIILMFDITVDWPKIAKFCTHKHSPTCAVVI